MHHPERHKGMDKRAEEAEEGTKSIIKQEPPDGEWPEVSVTVSDTLVVVVKRELDSDTESSPAELRGDPWNNKADDASTDLNITLVKQESRQAEASSTADIQSTASSPALTAGHHTASETHPLTEHTKLFCCNHCNYQCDSRSALTTHMRTHFREKPIKFKHFNYKCPEVVHMKRHTPTHTKEKPLTCTYCDYKSSHSGQLKQHVLIHTGEKPFSCTHCDYKSTHAGNLKRHMLTHTGEKPFSCTHCDYKSSDVGHLKCHMLTHTGEKPFSCTHCDYRFSRAGNLKRHMLTHTGGKPFRCTRCDYKCSRGVALKQHMLTHTSEFH